MHSSHLLRWTRAYGFLIASGVLLLLGGYVMLSAQRLVEESNSMAGSHRVIQKLSDLRARQDHSGIRVRNFLLDGTPAELAAFQSDESILTSTAEALVAEVSDSPQQLANATHLRTALGARRLGIERILQAKPAPDSRAVVARLSKLRQATEPLIRRMVAEQEAVLARREADSRRALSGLLGAVAFAIPFSLLIFGYGQSRLAAENRQRARAEEELQDSVTKLRRLSGELDALSSFAGMLQSAGTTDELLNIAVKTLPRMLPGTAGSLYLVKSSRDYAEDVASFGSHLIASDPLPAPGTCWAIRRQRAYVADAASDVLCAHCKMDDEPSADAASAWTACLPLGGQGESFGWVYLTSGRVLKAEELALAENACEQLSLALANMRLRDALRHQSVRDGLTGLYNRRYLEEGMAREIARCVRRQLPMSVIMFDLDHFKSYNDLHGHGGGDALLGAFAKVLEGACRGEDIPCRYGGEEFALVLPEAPAAVALVRADQIRKSLAGLSIMYMGRELGRVTLSAGVASLPVNGSTVRELLQAADAALYRAKQAGRDQVTAG